MSKLGTLDRELFQKNKAQFKDDFYSTLIGHCNQADQWQTDS